MFFVYNENNKKTEISFDADDACNDCPLMSICPLLKAIEMHVVYPYAAKFDIVECPLKLSIEVQEGQED